MSRQHFFIKPKIQFRYLLRTLSVVLITAVILYIFLRNEIFANLNAVVDSAYVNEIIWLSGKTFAVVTLILLIAFSLHSIFSTHSLAGAVYAFERIIKNIGEGNLRASIETRKGDELKETVVQLQDMNGKLRDAIYVDREKVNESIQQIEQIIDILQKNPQTDIQSRLKNLHANVSKITTHFKI